MPQDHRRIADHALIGNLRTAGLVHRDGSLDWLCLPDFDSPAVFARLLGDEDNGQWRLAPVDAGPADSWHYREDTMIVESQWSTPEGTVRLIDFMPADAHSSNVVRIVEGLDGEVRMRSTVRFRFDYGRVVPWLRHRDDRLVAVAGPDAVWLHTEVPLHSKDFATVSEFTVRAGERIPMVLSYAPSWYDEPDRIEVEQALQQTERFWRDWVDTCTYTGPYSELVRRSLLTLKALTFDPTGGLLAAPTTSLPEEPGGERNWDYRFCWLRDATFSLQAFLGCGFREEAAAWRHWLLRAAAGDPGNLQPMYTIRGARRLSEWTVPWLSGFAGSAPVRVGNSAAGQFQLDVWGEVLGGLNLARDYGIKDGKPTWRMQVKMLEALRHKWSEPDDGVWEVRGGRQHFVHSKALAWVAFDRMAWAVRDGLGEGEADEWQQIADTIHAQVCAQGFDRERNTFTQSYGSKHLDAATLLLSKVGFLPGDDPRMLGTIDAITQDLGDGALFRRYSTEGGDDGLSGSEGAFLACSFWMVEAMAAGGRRDAARDLFERVVALANDVGLMSEEYAFDSAQMLGNFPQAYSHVGLVNAALLLDPPEK